MNLHCPQCGEAILSGDINLVREIAKCGKCHAVFSFSGFIEHDQAGRATAMPSRPRNRPKMDLPRRLTMDTFGPNLIFRLRWYRPEVFLLAIFAAVWIGFLVVWYTIGISQAGENPDNSMIWCMLAFPIIHVFVGVGLVYLVLAIFLNTTIIEVGGGRITVRHGPVPWAGNCDLASGDVTQLFVKEKVFHGKRGRSVQYQLVAIDRGDRRVKLLENLDTPEIALYLEQEIESRLRIRDTPVPGEVMG